ncbi:hypothetical protein BGZ67_006723 [Mortierella alpina]|nr:hypothetical protein BGZ67_006723 [Mortierella alpina]
MPKVVNKEKLAQEPPFRKDGKATTRNEFAMLMRVHRYLQGHGPACELAKDMSPRKKLALVTGVSERVAGQAISLFINQQEPVRKKIGRPKKTKDAEPMILQDQ